MAGCALFFPLPWDVGPAGPDDDAPAADPVDAGRAVRAVACAVLVRAIAVALRLAACRPKDSVDALAFLADKEREADVRAWCELADVDADRLRRAVLLLLERREGPGALGGFGLADRIRVLAAGTP